MLDKMGIRLALNSLNSMQISQILNDKFDKGYRNSLGRLCSPIYFFRTKHEHIMV